MFSRKQKSLFIVFIAITASLAAQYAPGIEWKTIETKHFQIIFPDEISEQALTVAGKIDLIYQAESMDYGDFRQSRWPIVMTSSNMVANGYVAMPPRKSAWYSTPIVESSTALEWYDLLSLHETRHMVQYDRLNSRFIHLLYLLMGQNGLSLGITLGIPDWFFEGDAVATETLYSQSGRGRDPLFYQGMRDVVSNQDYSYQKMVNQSYRDLVPNHYELGYFLTSYVKKTYGEESFEQILKRATLIPFPSFGMYLGSKKLSGKSWSRLYEDMAEDLKTQWDEQNRSVDLIDNERITETVKDNTVRWEPLSLSDNSIYARRISLSEPPVLVKISEEGEQELMRIPGRGTISIQGDKAVWTYIRPSLLYQDLNWSDLVTIDLETGKKTYLTEKKRYLMPAYSHKGDTIAVIQWSSERKGSLLLIDDTTGEEFKEFSIDEGLFPANPAWSEDDKTIYFTVQGKKGRGIAGISLDTGSVTMLTDFSMEKIKNIHPWGDYILYSSDYSGFENIMAIRISTAEKFQISSRLQGVAKPLVGSYKGEEVLLYSEFAQGNSSNLVVQSLSVTDWIPEEDITTLSFVYYGENNVTKGSSLWNLERISNEAKTYSTEDIDDYSLLKGNLNVHSWSFVGVEDSETLSLELQSTDIMNTLNWTLGASYNVNEDARGANLDFIWSQFYPVISMSNEYWYREVESKDSHDLSSTFSVAFPFNLSRDIWVNTVSPSAGVGVDAIIDAENSGDPDTDIPVYYGFDWSSYLPGSYRSLNPIFGISQSFYYEHNPMQDSDHFFSGVSTFYLPGGLNNSLSLKGTYENQRGYYSSRTLFSRGYDEEEKENLYQFKADYAFPIVYPDAALGSFFFLKRLRGNLFYDYTALYEDWSDQSNYQSVGAELNLDFTAMNMKVLPLSLGLRFSWLIEENEPQVSFLLMDIGL
ncbi:MAG: hypothetical protein B6241_03275 [Spirochaetaceae bacterium 4572_59]|nr:MAG: hypothetical protein B6241_03275 [Spirochaetaceae bacterium 4572_59]